MLREEFTAHVAGVRLCEETRNDVYNYHDATVLRTYKLQSEGVNRKSERRSLHAKPSPSQLLIQIIIEC
jgi:hypothetical protein